jgi:hypothetical protein
VHIKVLTDTSRYQKADSLISKRIGMENVVVSIPKAVMDFIRQHEKNPSKYLEDSLLTVIESDLDAEIWPHNKIKRILEASLKAN